MSAEAPAAPEAPDTLYLLGIPVHNVTEQETLDWIAARARSGPPAQVVTSNLDFCFQAWRDPEMDRIHQDADLVLADGMPMVWLSGLFGPKLKARVAGSDIGPALGAVARDRGLSLYALGAAPGVAQKSMSLLQERSPGLKVAGCDSPPPAPILRMDHEAVLEKIRGGKPDLLLVAFGAPKQDKWIDLHRGSWDVGVAMGVGGTLDFIAQVQTRAPRWIQKIGLEWFWRLARQPRRLFKRYSSNFLFLVFILARLLLARLSPAGRRPVAARPDAERLRASGLSWSEFPPQRESRDAAACFRERAPMIERGPLVLDLSAFGWLNSLELGSLSRLAAAGRRSKRRLLLAGVSARVRRLLRAHHLDRHLDEVAGFEDAARKAAEGRDGASVRFERADATLRMILPRVLDADAAAAAAQEFASQRSLPGLRVLTVDGTGLEVVGSAGGLFLLRAGRAWSSDAGATVELRGFRKALRGALQKDGVEPGWFNREMRS